MACSEGALPAVYPKEDLGDEDLRLALRQADVERHTPLVLFGHMHHTLQWRVGGQAPLPGQLTMLLAGRLPCGLIALGALQEACGTWLTLMTQVPLSVQLVSMLAKVWLVDNLLLPCRVLLLPERSGRASHRLGKRRRDPARRQP